MAEGRVAAVPGIASLQQATDNPPPLQPESFSAVTWSMHTHRRIIATKARVTPTHNSPKQITEVPRGCLEKQFQEEGFKKHVIHHITNPAAQVWPWLAVVRLKTTE